MTRYPFDRHHNPNPGDASDAADVTVGAKQILVVETYPRPGGIQLFCRTSRPEWKEFFSSSQNDIDGASVSWIRSGGNIYGMNSAVVEECIRNRFAPFTLHTRTGFDSYPWQLRGLFSLAFLRLTTLEQGERFTLLGLPSQSTVRSYLKFIEKATKWFWINYVFYSPMSMGIDHPEGETPREPE